MNKVQALNSFWSGFGLKAYDENSVPDSEPFPYMTYESPVDDFDHKIASSASLWYRSSSWEDITLKEMQIANTISRGGVLVPFDGGVIWICKGNPWAQRMSDASDEYVKRIVLNVEIEYID